MTVLSTFSLISCNGNTSSDTESDGVNTDTGADTSTDTDSDISNEEPDKEPEKPLSIDELNKRDEVMATLDNNYLSRNEIVYKDINGKDVTVYTSSNRD